MNTWLAAALGSVVVAVGAFFYGMHVEHGRFMAFVAQVEAEGKVAADRAAQKAAEHRRAQEEVNRAYNAAQEATGAALADLRRELREARSYIRPVPVAAPAASGCGDSEAGRAYWSGLRERVEGALAGFEDAASGSVQRGAAALDSFAACAEWARRAAK
jgi:hypothetical protein